MKEKTQNKKHNPEYDKIVPNEIFDIEDSDEMAEMFIDMFGEGGAEEIKEYYQE